MIKERVVLQPHPSSRTWWFIHSHDVTKAFETKGGLYAAMDIAAAYIAGLDNLDDIENDVTWEYDKDRDVWLTQMYRKEK